jgi:hypothetical protein
MHVVSGFGGNLSLHILVQPPIYDICGSQGLHILLLGYATCIIPFVNTSHPLCCLYQFKQQSFLDHRHG